MVNLSVLQSSKFSNVAFCPEWGLVCHRGFLNICSTHNFGASLRTEFQRRFPPMLLSLSQNIPLLLDIYQPDEVGEKQGAAFSVFLIKPQTWTGTVSTNLKGGIFSVVLPCPQLQVWTGHISLPISQGQRVFSISFHPLQCVFTSALQAKYFSLSHRTWDFCPREKMLFHSTSAAPEWTLSQDSYPDPNLFSEHLLRSLEKSLRWVGIPFVSVVPDTIYSLTSPHSAFNILLRFQLNSSYQHPLSSTLGKEMLMTHLSLVMLPFPRFYFSQLSCSLSSLLNSRKVVYLQISSTVLAIKMKTSFFPALHIPGRNQKPQIWTLHM